jgi:phosphatidylglycerophosphatase A
MTNGKTERGVLDYPAAVIATFFGCGLAPLGPGTAGSAAAMAVAVFLNHHHEWSPLDFAILAVVATPLAVWASTRTAQAAGAHDPGKIVVDEVLGQWLAISGMSTFGWKSCVAAFALFRLFDIGKPFPVRRLEALPGGWGIVADDLGAGIYAALVLFGAGWFNLI